MKLSRYNSHVKKSLEYDILSENNLLYTSILYDLNPVMRILLSSFINFGFATVTENDVIRKRIN